MAPRNKNLGNQARPNQVGIIHGKKNKFKESRNRQLFDIRKLKSVQVIDYINSSWKRKATETLKIPKRRPKRPLPSSSSSSIPPHDNSVASENNSFNVFSDLIPQEITHETVVIDDSTVCADTTITNEDDPNLTLLEELDTTHIFDTTLKTTTNRANNSSILKCFPPDTQTEPKSNSELKNDSRPKNREPQSADDDCSSESGASVITVSDSDSESTNLQGDFSTKVSVKEIEVIEIDDADECEQLKGQKLQGPSSNVNDLMVIEEYDAFVVVSNSMEGSLGAIVHKRSSTDGSMSVLPKASTSSFKAPCIKKSSELDKNATHNQQHPGPSKDPSLFQKPPDTSKKTNQTQNQPLSSISTFQSQFLAYTSTNASCSTYSQLYLPSVPTLLTNIRVPRPHDRMLFVDSLTEGTARICNKVLRRWVYVRQLYLPIVQTQRAIRICSYNVLCQATIAKTLHLYRHLTCPERYYQLEWNYRSMLLAKEFAMISADIFCLQEVEQNHLYSFYLPVFNKLGYRGLYKKRTRNMVDGCAIFYKPSLRLLSNQPIEYFVGEDTVLDRDNIAQIARFEDVHSGRQICIANTHLLFNMKRGDVKLAQLAVLLANLDKECGQLSDRPCPYVICGDFNMKPNCTIYNFIRNGQMSFKNVSRGTISTSDNNLVKGALIHPDFMPSETNIGRDCRFQNKKDVNGTNASDAKRNDNNWTHPLMLGSVYDHIAVDSNEPEVSAFSYEGTSNPDFMFYSVERRNLKEGPLHLIRRLSLPAQSMLFSTLGPWPNEITPSDHIPLIAEFTVD